MTAAGLDNWEPGELALLSFETFVWITELLNLIDDGCPWPIGMQHARAAYLVKNARCTDGPLSYRVLLILPALNRRWATHRLMCLQPWTEKWGGT